jgi:single-strand DNA-binding protein
MASLNRVTIIGNLGGDPESRDTANSTVCNFTVATSEKVNGEDQTEWHRVVAWGKTAEACQKYLSKGASVYVDGKIQTRKWEKDGVTRYSTEIVARQVQFLGGKADSGQRQEPAVAPAATVGVPEDDFPF